MTPRTEKSPGTKNSCAAPGAPKQLQATALLWSLRPGLDEPHIVTWRQRAWSRCVSHLPSWALTPCKPLRSVFLQLRLAPPRGTALLPLCSDPLVEPLNPLNHVVRISNAFSPVCLLPLPCVVSLFLLAVCVSLAHPMTHQLNPNQFQCRNR